MTSDQRDTTMEDTLMVPRTKIVEDFLKENVTKEESWDKEKISLLQMRCDQTVRLKVSHDSENNQGNFSNNELQEKRSTTYGTGFINRFQFWDAIKDVPCPCKLCRDLETPEMKHWRIIVRTSKRVLCNEEDAKNVQIDCFFDYGNTVDVNACKEAKQLYGLCMDYSFRSQTDVNESNITEIVCVTHDETTVSLLKKKLRPAFKDVGRFGINYLQPLPGLIIYHPFGQSKKISVCDITHLTVPLEENYKKNQPIPFMEETRYRLPPPHREVKGEFLSAPGNEEDDLGDLAEKQDDYKYILPLESQYAIRYHKEHPGWWKFPKGTTFISPDGSECSLPDDTEFRNDLYYPQKCNITYENDTCPGSEGASVYCDLLDNPLLSNFVHEEPQRPPTNLEMENQEINAARSEMAALKQFVQAIREELRTYQSKIDPLLLNDDTNLLQDYKSLVEDTKMKNDEIECLKNDLLQTKKEMERTNYYLKRKDDVIEDVQGELQEKEKEMKEMKEILHKQQQELADMKKGMRTEFERQDKQFENVDKNIKNMKREVDETKHEYNKKMVETDEKIQKVKEDLFQQKEELGNVKKDLEEKDKKLIDVQNDLVEKDKKLIDVQNDLVEKYKKLIDVQNDLVEKDKVTEDFKQHQKLELQVSNLKTETSTLKAKVNHQEQQQQQLQEQHQQLQIQQQQMQQPPQQSGSSKAPSPTPGAVAASLPVKKPSPTPGAVAASLPVKKLTPEQLKKIQMDSKFNVCVPSIPGGLRTGQPTRVGYHHVRTPSPYLNMKSGVYKTPVQGKYTFGGWMGQGGYGKMSLFVCGDRKGRRELFCETHRYDDLCVRYVSWECEEGECVWLEVVRTEGEAVVLLCEFLGKLME